MRKLLWLNESEILKVPLRSKCVPAYCSFSRMFELQHAEFDTRRLFFKDRAHLKSEVYEPSSNYTHTRCGNLKHQVHIR